MTFSEWTYQAPVSSAQGFSSGSLTLVRIQGFRRVEFSPVVHEKAGTDKQKKLLDSNENDHSPRSDRAEARELQKGNEERSHPSCDPGKAMSATTAAVAAQ